MGDVGLINNHNQNAFYLITKRHKNFKPTTRVLEKALQSLCSKMKDLNLTKLGIAKIGCGFEELEWDDVKSLIINIFSGSSIHITVCMSSKVSIKITNILCSPFNTKYLPSDSKS